MRRKLIELIEPGYSVKMTTTPFTKTHVAAVILFPPQEHVNMFNSNAKV